jgi:hypothetical protein
VQPKTNTPAVGCTLRSLTHNLALVPSVASVATRWRLANNDCEDLDPFNLLIVPFPFAIPGTSFKKIKGSFPGGPTERAFTLNPKAWMGEATEEEFAAFLLGLFTAAELELESVHAIILPETALPRDFAHKVAGILARESSLDLFITGVVYDSPRNSPDDQLEESRNMAAVYRFFERQVASTSYQSKHHRWLLNGDQIRRYHLGHVLDPNCKWWEQIDVSSRHCDVMLFRPQATLGPDLRRPCPLRSCADGHERDRAQPRHCAPDGWPAARESMAGPIRNRARGRPGVRRAHRDVAWHGAALQYAR